MHVYLSICSLYMSNICSFVIIIQYKNAFRIKNPLKKKHIKHCTRSPNLIEIQFFVHLKYFMHTMKWGHAYTGKKTAKNMKYTMSSN